MIGIKIFGRIQLSGKKLRIFDYYRQLRDLHEFNCLLCFSKQLFLPKTQFSGDIYPLFLNKNLSIIKSDVKI